MKRKLLTFLFIFLLGTLLLVAVLLVFGNNFTAKGVYMLNESARKKTEERIKKLAENIQSDNVKIAKSSNDYGCSINRLGKRLYTRIIICEYGYKVLYSTTNPQTDYVNLYRQIERAGWVSQLNGTQLARFLSADPYSVEALSAGNDIFNLNEETQIAKPTLFLFLGNDSGKRTYGYIIKATYFSTSCELCFRGQYVPE